jgi:WD40 repeat protein
MMQPTRFFLVAILLMLSAVFPIQAQEDSPYLPITPDSLNQLQPLFSLPCGQSRNGTTSAAFSGDVFVYECNNDDPVFTIYSFEDKFLWQYTNKLWPWPRTVTLLEGGDLILADFQTNLRLIRRTEGEIAHVEFITHAPVAISPDLKRVAVVQGEWDNRVNTVVIYSLPDFTSLEVSFPVTGQPTEAMLALTDVEQGLIAIGENNGTIRVLEVETGDVVMETSLLDTGLDYRRYIDATFTPDTTQLLVSICTFDEMGCWEVGLLRFDVESGELVKGEVMPQLGSDVKFIGFSGETSLLLATGSNCVQFFDVETFTTTDSHSVTDGSCSFNVSFNDDRTLLGIYDSPSETYIIYGIPRP